MKKLKLNKKILNIVILILVVTVTSVVTVFAERIIASSTVTYSNSSSGLASTNVQGALDELYGKAKCLSSKTFAESLKNCIPASNTVIVDDGTADHNMRYMGVSPKNYVTFAGEEWRIIGVFNNIDNGTGKKESRVKIIKAESIENKKWNTFNINIWKNASLNTELQELSFFSSNLIENAGWYLGDPGGDQYAYTASQAYEYERGIKVASGNDMTWTGKVGLMYPSDYGFASSSCKDGSETLFGYHNTPCLESNWLYSGSIEWLMSPNSGDSIRARAVSGEGLVGDGGVASALVIRPVVFLKSRVTCKNCTDSTAGTQANPFQLG